MAQKRRRPLEELFSEREWVDLGFAMQQVDTHDDVVEVVLRIADRLDSVKKQKPFGRAAGHQPGCICEICFAPALELSKNIIPR